MWQGIKDAAESAQSPFLAQREREHEFPLHGQVRVLAFVLDQIGLQVWVNVAVLRGQARYDRDWL